MVPPLVASAVLVTSTVSTEDGRINQATTKTAKAIKQAINIAKPPLKYLLCAWRITVLHYSIFTFCAKKYNVRVEQEIYQKYVQFA